MRGSAAAKGRPVAGTIPEEEPDSSRLSPNPAAEQAEPSGIQSEVLDSAMGLGGAATVGPAAVLTPGLTAAVSLQVTEPAGLPCSLCVCCMSWTAGGCGSVLPPYEVSVLPQSAQPGGLLGFRRDSSCAAGSTSPRPRHAHAAQACTQDPALPCLALTSEVLCHGTRRPDLDSLLV